MDVVYLADRHEPGFEQQRLAVDVVCAGDSLTGWNNFGPTAYWPFPTYPRFLQARCEPRGLQVADGGIAGEVSDNGPGHVRRYLGLFPNARFFVICFGANDLGTWPDLESTSQRILANLDAMVQAVRDEGKRPLLFDIPYANEAMFPPHIARDTHEKRDYHNERLREFCQQRTIPLVDVCSHLRREHFGDELHPNEAGARVIADKVFEALERALGDDSETTSAS